MKPGLHCQAATGVGKRGATRFLLQPSRLATLRLLLLLQSSFNSSPPQTLSFLPRTSTTTSAAHLDP